MKHRYMKYIVVAGAAACALMAAVVASASPVVVPGPSPVAPAADTVIDFEGQAEGALISTQYATLGVTFLQPDGGRPMIDNDPFLFFYTANSGNGVLTGSTEGGAPFPTVAGMTATFALPTNLAGAYFSDTDADHPGGSAADRAGLHGRWVRGLGRLRAAGSRHLLDHFWTIVKPWRRLRYRRRPLQRRRDPADRGRLQEGWLDALPHRRRDVQESGRLRQLPRHRRPQPARRLTPTPT